MEKNEEHTGAVEEFKAAQERLLKRFGVDAGSHFLEAPSIDGRVHVLRYGEGPPVVLVPGFGDPTAMWAPLMARLDGFSLYAVDRPCFGLTGCARHAPETFRSLAVAFLSQVLDTLGLRRPLIVGNSIGSLWTTWLAIDRPERVSAMVHIGCPAFLLGTSAPLPMRLLSIRPLGRLAMRTPPSRSQVETFARVMGGEDLSNLPELADLLMASQRLPGALRATRELLHAVVRLRGARPEVALTARQLGQVHQPVQLIWGGKDAFGPPEVGQQAAGLLPDAEFHVIPGGGHIPWVGHTDRVASTALPFLRVHAANAS